METQKEFLPIKQSVIGIIYQEGKFFAEIVRDIEAKDLKSLLKKESFTLESLQKYSDLAFKGHLHRFKKECRINPLEGFWDLLKENYLPGAEFGEKDYLFISENIAGDIIPKINFKSARKNFIKSCFPIF